MSHVLRGMLLLLLVSAMSGTVALDSPGVDNLPGNRISGSDILPVDEAFRLGSYPSEAGLVVFWQVLPGYYLYRDKIGFIVDGEELPVDLPRGAMRQDEVFGEVEVIEGLVEITLPVQENAVEVRYQGCAERGYCYPPQAKSLNFLENAGKSSDLLEKRRKPL